MKPLTPRTDSHESLGNCCSSLHERISANFARTLETELNAANERVKELENLFGTKFKRGDDVRKIKGSCWSGKVVGEYSTELTPEGFVVESSSEIGSCQLYPAAALELNPAIRNPSDPKQAAE